MNFADNSTSCRRIFVKFVFERWNVSHVKNWLIIVLNRITIGIQEFLVEFLPLE